MGRFLSNFVLDKTSFWLGFLAATLLWWLVRLLRPRLKRFADELRERYRLSRMGIDALTGVRIRNNMLRIAQELHIAAPLFSLDEILIQPHLLAPAPPMTPGQTPPLEDIAAAVVPFMPSWPELAATYQAPRLSITETLRGDANLVLIGNPGSGKTVTLLYLLIQIIKREIPYDGLLDKIPLFLPAYRFNINEDEIEHPLDVLIEALLPMLQNVTQDNLTKYLDQTLNAGNVLLLIDGLEEISLENINGIVDYLKLLIKQYPDVRIITTSSSDYFDGLLKLSFVPLPISAWNKFEREKFIKNWSRMWINFIQTQSDEPTSTEPVLLNAWLLNDSATFSPLELTLKVWAAYAADALGPKPIDGLEAYIRRMSTSGDGTRSSLEKIALHRLLNQNPVFTHNEAKNWVRYSTSLTDPSAHFDPGENKVESTPGAEDQPIIPNESGRVNIPELLMELARNGLMISLSDNHFRFVHQTIANYLAGCARDDDGLKEQIIDTSMWTTPVQFLGYSLIRSGTTSLLQRYLDRNQNPLQRELLHAGLWLRDISDDVSWVNQVMRQLVDILSNDTHAISLRAQAATALATSSKQGVSLLFRQLLKAESPEMRQLAALCCGQIGDVKAVTDLNSLVGDPVPNVRRSVFLALVAIGNDTALNIVADGLLHGEEDTRRLAAEALANDPEEGYPILKEGSTIDDLLVRRAVVFGLQRVNKPWAIKLLNKIQLEEEQWVVRTAATEALGVIEQPDPRIPTQQPPLTKTPWLIAFAGERGIGVSPGKPAFDLLITALREGGEDERLAALIAFRMRGTSMAIPAIYETYYGDLGELREAAYDTLWHIFASGVELPPPAKFGLGS